MPAADLSRLLLMRQNAVPVCCSGCKPWRRDRGEGGGAMAYPLGGCVVSQTLVRRERWPGRLKAKWTALVYPGQEVQPDQPVMRMEMTQLVPEKTAVPGFSLRTAAGG